MNGIAIMAIAIVALVCGYIFYGKYLAKIWASVTMLRHLLSKSMTA